MLASFSRFSPDFLKKSQYKSVKQQVKTELEESENPLTVREIVDRTGIRQVTASARASELVNEGKAVQIPDWRECTVADHNREVNVYGVPPYEVKNL